MLRLIQYPLSTEDASESLVREHIIANHLRNGLAEFVGTFFLVAIGTGVAVETALEKPIAGETAGTLGTAWLLCPKNFP
jgi:hypothetical protein